MHISALSLQVILRAIDHLILGRPVVSLLLIAVSLLALSNIVQRWGRTPATLPGKSKVLQHSTEDTSV